MKEKGATGLDSLAEILDKETAEGSTLTGFDESGSPLSGEQFIRKRQRGTGISDAFFKKGGSRVEQVGALDMRGGLDLENTKRSELVRDVRRSETLLKEKQKALRQAEERALDDFLRPDEEKAEAKLAEIRAQRQARLDASPEARTMLTKGLAENEAGANVRVLEKKLSDLEAALKAANDELNQAQLKRNELTDQGVPFATAAGFAGVDAAFEKAEGIDTEIEQTKKDLEQAKIIREQKRVPFPMPTTPDDVDSQAPKKLETEMERRIRLNKELGGRPVGRVESQFGISNSKLRLADAIKRGEFEGTGLMTDELGVGAARLEYDIAQSLAEDQGLIPQGKIRNFKGYDDNLGLLNKDSYLSSRLTNQEVSAAIEFRRQQQIKAGEIDPMTGALTDKGKEAQGRFSDKATLQNIQDRDWETS
jgi:hypothetical protein